MLHIRQSPRIVIVAQGGNNTGEAAFTSNADLLERKPPGYEESQMIAAVRQRNLRKRAGALRGVDGHAILDVEHERNPINIEDNRWSLNPEDGRDPRFHDDGEAESRMVEQQFPDDASSDKISHHTGDRLQNQKASFTGGDGRPRSRRWLEAHSTLEEVEEKASSPRQQQHLTELMAYHSLTLKAEVQHESMPDLRLIDEPLHLSLELEASEKSWHDAEDGDNQKQSDSYSRTAGLNHLSKASDIDHKDFEPPKLPDGNNSDVGIHGPESPFSQDDQTDLRPPRMESSTGTLGLAGGPLEYAESSEQQHIIQSLFSGLVHWYVRTLENLWAEIALAREMFPFSATSFAWISRQFPRHIARIARLRLSALLTHINLRGLPGSVLCKVTEATRQYLEPPVSPGMKRLCWQCRCGVLIYDDYAERSPELPDSPPGELHPHPGPSPSPERAMIGLHGSEKARTPASNDDSDEAEVFTSAQPPANGSNQQPAQQGVGLSLGDIGASLKNTLMGHPKTNSLPTHNTGNSVAQSIPANAPPTPDHLEFLLLCIPFKSHTNRLLNVDTTMPPCSDIAFFRLLRQTYTENRGRLRSLFSIRTLT